MSRIVKNLGVVDACFTTPASRSRAARRLGGKSVLEWVARRATDALRLDGVIVVTCDVPENAFVGKVVPLDVPVYVGRRADPLDCFARALEEYQPEGAVRIVADCIFMDPSLIDRLVIVAEEHPGCDYVGYCCRAGDSPSLAPVQLLGEWVRAKAVWQAARRARSTQDRIHPTRYVYSHPQSFHVRFIRPPVQFDREDLRLSIEMDEEWEHTVTIFETFGPDHLEWQRIAELLDHQLVPRTPTGVLHQPNVKG